MYVCISPPSLYVTRGAIDICASPAFRTTQARGSGYRGLVSLSGWPPTSPPATSVQLMRSRTTFRATLEIDEEVRGRNAPGDTVDVGVRSCPVTEHDPAAPFPPGSRDVLVAEIVPKRRRRYLSDRRGRVDRLDMAATEGRWRPYIEQRTLHTGERSNTSCLASFSFFLSFFLSFLLSPLPFFHPVSSDTFFEVWMEQLGTRIPVPLSF